MAYNSIGLTNVFLACITIINLITVLLLYQAQKGKKP